MGLNNANLRRFHCKLSVENKSASSSYSPYYDALQIALLLLLGRVALVRGLAELSNFPVDDLSVCPMPCGKMADRIRMPFGIIGRTSPGSGSWWAFGDRSTERGTFGANLGRDIVTNGDLLSQ